eukprot:Nk52_evm18s745 gene=Nk52_evmTU18s745
MTKWACESCRESRRPLHFAAFVGHLECIQWYFKNGIDLNDCTKDDGFSPVHWASLHGHKTCLEWLVANGGDVNRKDNNGWTSVHLAALKGNFACLQFLLTKGGIINGKDNYGSTPLHKAVINGHYNCYRLLLSKGGDSTAIDELGWEILHCAAFKGGKDCFDEIADVAKNIDKQDFTGDTAAHLAAGEGHVHVLQKLYELGANFMILNNREETAYDIALRLEREQCILFLESITNGVPSIADFGNSDLDSLPTVKEDSVRSSASSPDTAPSNKQSNVSSVEKLGPLTESEDPLDVYVGSKYPLHDAAFDGNIPCMKYYVDTGHDVNEKDNEENTALHKAIENNQVKAVEWLLENGASMYLQNLNSVTPQSLAREMGNQEILDILGRFEGTPAGSLSRRESVASMSPAIQAMIDSMEKQLELERLEKQRLQEELDKEENRRREMEESMKPSNPPSAPESPMPLNESGVSKNALPSSPPPPPNDQEVAPRKKKSKKSTKRKSSKGIIMVKDYSKQFSITGKSWDNKKATHKFA